MSSKRNQTIAIARFLMYKHGLNQQLEGILLAWMWGNM